VPVLAAFVLLQRFFVAGLTAGAVKGETCRVAKCSADLQVRADGQASRPALYPIFQRALRTMD
jgi:hypothetical protein